MNKPTSPGVESGPLRVRAGEHANGADVLYAPGLPDIASIRAVCAAVSKPVNVVMGLQGRAFSVAELAAAGVRRISLGSALSRAALRDFVRAVREIRERGTFTFADTALPFSEANEFMAGKLARQ